MILIIAWYIATYITLSTAVTEVPYGDGFCGKHSIPYKISINRNGSPEIFCKTPACLGKDTRINTGLYNTRQYQSRRNMTVICDAFKETVCTGELQWTSALLESNNKTQKTLKSKCCSYPGMIDAEQLRIIFLGLGDSYEGGIIRKDGYFGGFDLIKEVRKTITTDNKVKYLVTVNRLPCDMNSNEGKEDRRFHSKPYILQSKRRQQDIRMRGLKKKYWNEDDESITDSFFVLSSEASHQHDGSRRNTDYTALNYDTRRTQSGRRKSIQLFRKEYSDADNNDDDGEDDDYDVLIPRKIVASKLTEFAHISNQNTASDLFLWNLFSKLKSCGGQAAQVMRGGNRSAESAPLCSQVVDRFFVLLFAKLVQQSDSQQLSSKTAGGCLCVKKLTEMDELFHLIGNEVTLA
uniref:DUF2235 domain-containing protein n=1 Tax=Heterorhabditis bacteriophora TaxID=37862 RepID=A0A1I7WUP0_HETBA